MNEVFQHFRSRQMSELTKSLMLAGAFVAFILAQAEKLSVRRLSS
jgi:hypothetical protein